MNAPDTVLSAFIDKPRVLLRMDPEPPIYEEDRQNVTFFCDVIDGNPQVLTMVKWFMDGLMLNDFPVCTSSNETNNEDLCHVVPNMLMLEHVNRKFFGNFSCQGANEAGWGEVSDERLLDIFCEYFDQTDGW